MNRVLELGLYGIAATAAFAADKPADPAAKPEKKICRREDVIGSIIPAHICLTRTEWDQLDAYYEERDKSFLLRKSEGRGTLKSVDPGS
jgi:hypothetical protein